MDASSELEGLQRALPRRYSLVRELQHGGMSRVYLAREELPDREVAIKVLDEHLSARLGRERFVREVQLTSRLSHPYIVPIYAAGEAGGTLYYVMPYISGESLRHVLELRHNLPVDEALRVTLQVADALAHAHAQEIVHRDIKPGNILFQSGHAVVTDFGIARALRAADDASLTQSGLALGTPDYMSPEQISGDPVDARSDVYSLGCVLFEMLGGQAPFHSRTPEATLARHLADTVPSVKALRGTVSDGLEAVVHRALAKSPEDRYQSAGELARAIRQVDSAATGTLVTPDTVHRRRRHTSFERSLQIAGTLLVVAALGVAYQSWSSDPALVLAASPYRDSVAIMPLTNRTGDSTLDNLGYSFADEIIDHLHEVPEVQVISTYSVVSLWDKNLGMVKLLDTLHVGHLFEGSYELREDTLVITVSRFDPAGALVDRSTFRGRRAAIDSLRTSVAHGVAEGFLETLGLSRTFARDDPVTEPSRDAYLAANAWLGQRTPEATRRAITLFEQAIALDSTHAAAYAGLSNAMALSLFYAYDVGIDPYELAARALVLADDAVRLAPNDAAGHTARGFIRGLLGQDIDEAEQAFRRALEIAPNAPNGPSWSARILEARGLIDEAFAEARRARDLDPFQSGRRITLAGLALQRGDHEMAVLESRAALALAPGLEAATAFEGRALVLAGRPRECLRLQLEVYRVVRALCLAAAGRRSEATEVVASAEGALAAGLPPKEGYTGVLTAQDLAVYYGFHGDAAQAIRWVEDAFRRSPFGIDTRLLRSDLFDPVRGARGFGEAVTRARGNAWARVLEERRLEEARSPG